MESLSYITHSSVRDTFTVDQEAQLSARTLEFGAEGVLWIAIRSQ